MNNSAKSTYFSSVFTLYKKSCQSVRKSIRITLKIVFLSWKYAPAHDLIYDNTENFDINSEIQCMFIIIMSCRQHGYPWPSLATSPYHSSPPAGLLGYILCPHIAAVCMFGLVVLLLLGHMWGSIGVHHLRARPCFSSSVRRVWLV